MQSRRRLDFIGLITYSNKYNINDRNYFSILCIFGVCSEINGYLGIKIQRIQCKSLRFYIKNKNI